MKVTLALKQIDLKEHGFHLFLKMNLNRRSFNFLLDTGASRTVMDVQSAKRIMKEDDFKKNEFMSAGLGTNSMESQNVIIRSMKFGRIVLWNYPMVLIPLDHVNASYLAAGFKTIDGVLGCDILKQLGAVIDLSKNTITLRHV